MCFLLQRVPSKVKDEMFALHGGRLNKAPEYFRYFFVSSPSMTRSGPDFLRFGHNILMLNKKMLSKPG